MKRKLAIVTNTIVVLVGIGLIVSVLWLPSPGRNMGAGIIFILYGTISLIKRLKQT